MADKKISELSLLTSPTAGVQIPVVDPVEVDVNLKNKYLPYKAFVGATGWIPVSDTWTYASATTITVPAGAASIYSVGMGIRLTANSVVKQAYIVKVENTLLTVAGDALTNYAFSAISYTPTPQTAIGFPVWFNYTPVGISAANVSLLGRFILLGRNVTVYFIANFTGAITFTTMPTLPIKSSASILGIFADAFASNGPAGYLDAGSATEANQLHVHVAPNSTTFAISGNANPGIALSATFPITWANGDVMQGNFTYEI